DSVNVLFFSTQLRWLSERPQPLSSARAGAVNAIAASFADGGTALYDAIAAACRSLPESGAAARAVIVLTDGKDTDSRMKLPELIGLLSRGNGEEDSAPVRVFTIAYGSEADPGVLKQIAEAGGGAFFAGTPK